MEWAIKGNIVFTKTSNELNVIKDGIIVCKDNKIKDVYTSLPKEYETIEITDYGNKIIIPGLVDLHVHAPQYSYKGCGMDLELLEWLDTYTFVEEAKYSDIEYAKTVYKHFVNDLKNGATTRASIFASVHVQSTKLLMDMLEESGLITYVGKVNMNRNCNEDLNEGSANQAKVNTVTWLQEVINAYKNTSPIITPRFIPSCNDELLEELGNLSKQYDLKIQSHLSENKGEIEWVRQLKPEAKFYGDGYDIHGLFTNQTIMAHCVYSVDEEIELMKKNGVYVAHCPTSNMNLSSGIAPIKKYLEKGLHVGLGSDVAASHSLSIFKAMADAIAVSKLRWRLVDELCTPLKIPEVLYMATKGGGSFFGKVGSFEKGYHMDAIVIDDSNIQISNNDEIMQRIEKIIYQDYQVEIVAKYVDGKKLF